MEVKMNHNPVSQADPGKNSMRMVEKLIHHKKIFLYNISESKTPKLPNMDRTGIYYEVINMRLQ